MERLTKRDFVFDSHYVASHLQHWSIAQCLKKLQEYENAEEDGLLLVLPCKIGSIVYVTEDMGDWQDVPCGHEKECEICDTDCRLYAQKYVIKPVITEKIVMSYLDTQLVKRELGKTVFLTREEAEAALAERG